MPRTADFIEESKSLKPQTSPKKHNVHPNSIKNLIPFVAGVSGNPGGKPKYDVGAQIARAVLDQNSAEAYKALTKALLKGNAYVFKELCERGYGKLKESHEVTHIHQDVPDADLNKRISEIERDLGLTAAIDEAGRIGLAQAGSEAPSVETEDPAILPR